MRVKFNEIDEQEIVKKVKDGKIFVYPTDTIYGIGCDATNFKSVKKIREIKKQEAKPFSVIAPSKKWIRDNLVVDEDKLKLLPGPYTLILKLKNKAVADNVNLELGSLGVRIPGHRFSEIIRKANLPFVSTSVNITTEKPITQVSEISKRILNKVDIIVDDGILDNQPSTIIDINGKIIKRNQNL